MSIFFMLYWLIGGVLGFLVLAGTIWQLIIGWVERDGIRNNKWRHVWLEYWFGKEGAMRWMAHEERVLEMRKLGKYHKGDWGYNRQWAVIETRQKREGMHCYDANPKKGPNGTVIGTIYWSTVWEWRGIHPPWGVDYVDLDMDCIKKNPPRAFDWFAAGYWDKGVEAAWAEACSSEWPDHLLADNAFYYKAQDEWQKQKVKRLAGQKGLYDRMMAPNPWADGLKERLRKEAEENKDPELEAFVQSKVGDKRYANHADATAGSLR